MQRQISRIKAAHIAKDILKLHSPEITGELSKLLHYIADHHKRLDNKIIQALAERHPSAILRTNADKVASLTQQEEEVVDFWDALDHKRAVGDNGFRQTFVARIMPFSHRNGSDEPANHYSNGHNGSGNGYYNGTPKALKGKTKSSELSQGQVEELEWLEGDFDALMDALQTCVDQKERTAQLTSAARLDAKKEKKRGRQRIR